MTNIQLGLELFFTQYLNILAFLFQFLTLY
jgi:hypothetical protein